MNTTKYISKDFLNIFIAKCLFLLQSAFILNTPSYDPCSNYVSLDQPWRANTGSGMGICDRNFNWNGWYRLFYYGMNIRMSESCVDVNRCGTYYTLWLNDPHPEIEDGVVTRQVCGNSGNDCCYFKSNPIRVKACPGNYYVYEFLSPMTCNMAYCTAGLLLFAHDLKDLL
uniref:UMOD/GP2/OIT3-like D8C domain-containing protein n=1 Tax=Astyanax mexicanus TaxID=7994 RepID=A0A3B1K6E7_ASTMX